MKPPILESCSFCTAHFNFKQGLELLLVTINTVLSDLRSSCFGNTALKNCSARACAMWLVKVRSDSRSVCASSPFQTEGVTRRLAERNDFVLFLFTLMTNKKTFLQTATLIEDILGVKKVCYWFLIFVWLFRPVGKCGSFFENGTLRWHSCFL